MLLFKCSLRTVFLDDNKKYLESLEEIFSNLKGSYSYFCDVDKFKKALVANTNATKELEKIAKFIFEDMNLFSFTKQLLKQLKKHKNNLYISVVVADYQLNNLETGVDILSSIQEKNIFKILHTGIAEENIAINAFHDEQIDGYFKKSDSVDNLIALIRKGNSQYFQYLSDFILSSISAKSNLDSALLDAEFKDFFNKLVARNNIEEYYLLDQYGSHLCLDRYKKYYTLLVMPVSTISSQIEILEEMNLGNDATDVLNRRKLLYIKAYQPDSCENSL